MSLSITFSEPTTVNTGSNWTCSDSAYGSGFGLWMLLGFRAAHADVLQTSATAASGTWTMRTLPSTSTYRAIAYASTLGTIGRAVIVGNGVAAWSDDGTTWAAATSLPSANNWCDVVWWPEKAIFVACASSGANRIMTSTDGKSWTDQSAASALSWQGLAVSATTAVCVAYDTVAGTQLVQTSTDGAAWSLQTHPSLSTNRGLVGGGAARLGIDYSPTLSMFLMTGTAAGVTKAYRSTDSGVTWTPSNVIPTISDSTNRGYVWLDAASSWYMPCANLNYGESTDGVTWTVTALSTTHSGYTPMGWDDSGAHLVGGSTLGFDTALLGVITGVDGVSPSTGTRHGGTVCTITGVGLTGVTSVTFGGTAAASVVVAADGQSLTCIAPAHAVGTVDVVITGIGTLTGAYTYVSVDSVVPRSGSTAGGQSVIIRGSGFNAATSVSFGGTAATAWSITSDTAIAATTPAHSSGAVDVVVGGVDTGSSLYTYTIAFDLLPPIPVRVPPVQGISQVLDRSWVLWLQAVKNRVETPVDVAVEQITGAAALSSVNDTNVTLDLTGTPETALLQAVTITAGWTGRLGVTRGGTGLGSITTGDLLYGSAPQTYAALADVAAGSYLRSGGVGVAPLWSTLVLPNAANSGDILKASSANTYASVAPGALTRTNDTNVTLTLGGSASTALVNAASLTLGWTGTLALTRGGLGGDFSAIAKGGLFVGTAAATVGLKTVGADGTVLIADAASAGGVKWDTLSTLTIPYTSVVSVPTATVLGRNTAGTGAAEALSTIPSAVQDNITRLGQLATAVTIDVNTGTLPTPLAGTVLHLGGADATACRLSFDAFGSNPVMFMRRANGTLAGKTGIVSGNVVFNITGDGYDSSGAYGTGGAIAYRGMATETWSNTAHGCDAVIYVTPSGTVGIAEGLRIDNRSNLLLNAALAPGTGTAVIVLPLGTAPSSLASNTAAIYADDVGGTVEDFAINEAGELARLTGLTARNSAQFDKTTSTTLANVTGLSRNVAAGVTYRFEAVLFITADVTGGSKFAIAGTATATAIVYDIVLTDESTLANSIVSRQTALAGSAGQAGTTSGLCRITGTITVNAAGTLTVQFAQNASNATSSVLANSTFRIEQVT